MAVAVGVAVARPLTVVDDSPDESDDEKLSEALSGGATYGDGCGGGGSGFGFPRAASGTRYHATPSTLTPRERVCGGADAAAAAAAALYAFAFSARSPPPPGGTETEMNEGLASFDPGGVA